MTTPIHSHKAWTDEGGHVKLLACLEFQDIFPIFRQKPCLE